MGKERESFPRRMEKSVKALVAARGEKGGFWQYATLVGMGGWLFAIPVVAGAYLGRYLDRRVSGGTSWTVTFILIGVAAGIYNLWHYLFSRGDR